MTPTLILMCGLPGSGKTTTALKLARALPAVRLCTDDWQAALGVGHANETFHDLLEEQLWRFGRELLRVGQTVIFEKGLWRRDEREEKRREAKALGVDIEFHYFDVPLEELERRLAARKARGNGNAFPVTPELLQTYATGFFQAPDESELGPFALSIVHKHA